MNHNKGVIYSFDKKHQKDSSTSAKLELRYPAMYNCILIDDDPFSLENLANMLDKFPDFQIIRKTNKSSIAIKYIMTLKPDVVLLDIDMPEKNGIEVLNEINELDISTYVIFITAHKEYIVDAFKNKAFDYLLKPISIKELDETLSRISNKTVHEESGSNKPNQRRITLRNAHGTTIMEPNNILYLQAEGCYTKIHSTNDSPELISKNIGKLEEEFPPYSFFRISRSTLVNINYITKIDRLKKMITVNFNGQSIQLKASRNRLYDLESKIRKLE